MNLYSIPPLLNLGCFLLLAGITLFRGQRNAVNHLFLIICLLGSLLNIDILVAFNTSLSATALKMSRIDHFLLVYLLPVYIHFFHLYLNIRHRNWLVYSAYIYAFVLMCITPTPLYIGSMESHYFGFFAQAGPLYALFGFGGLFVTAYVLLLLYGAIRKEKQSARKSQLTYVFAGFGLMGAMNGLNVLPIYGYSVYPPGNLSFIPLILFGVGVLKYRILDLDILIKKGLIYTLLTTLLTCLYALIILIASKMMDGFNLSDSLYFPVVFFLIVAIVVGPLKDRIQKLIDRVFYKGKYDYQKTLKLASQAIASILNINEIATYLMDTIMDAMKIHTGSLYLTDASGSHFSSVTSGKASNHDLADGHLDRSSPLIQYLAGRGSPIIKRELSQKDSSSKSLVRHELDRLQGEIILPLIFKDSLNGFIVLSEKRSGDLFTAEDIDLLVTLANQTALAVENARSYEEIEDLNQNLEAKVRDRTKALQAALTEKERTQEQLIQSESLAAIGQLVAGTAHELNNPLASVTSLIQSAAEELSEWDGHTPPDELLIEDLQFAGKELNRAKDIVASLLGLSRQTQQYSEKVDINAVLVDALRVLRNQYKHLDINIEKRLDGNLPKVQGNFANLGQVAINIIKNAIQAMEGGSGTISLTTRRNPGSRTVEFECRDTGPGIPSSNRGDIFKPFFTTKEVGQGTGLGLYICHEIIRRHRGTVQLAQAAEGGAAFVVTLPIRDDSIDTPTPS